MEQKQLQNQLLIEDLTIWRHKIWGAKYAAIPSMTFRSNPLVLNDQVIASVFSPGMIYSVERNTGRQRWRLRLNGVGGDSVITAYKTIYGKTPHTLYAIDRSSGKVRWTYCPYGTKGEYIYSSPTIADEMLFFGDIGGRFHCLDAKTGKKIWCKQLSKINDAKNTKKNYVNTTAVFHDGLIITSSNAGFVIAFEPSTGKQIWKRRLDGGSSNELCIVNGRVFIQTWHSIYLLHPESGKVDYKVSWRKAAISRTGIAGDKIMVAFMNEGNNANDPEKILCLQKNKVLYKLTIPYGTAPWGIVSFNWDKKRRLLYASRIGGLSIINPENGEVVHDVKSKKTFIYPGIVNVQKGIIYILNMNGAIYAIRHP